MAMLPRFAPIVSRTASFTIRSSCPVIRNTSMVNGIKVSNVTSFVIIMLEKKQRSTIIADRARRLSARLRSACPSKVKSPLDLSPATRIIRQNRSAMVLQSG